MAFPRRVLPTSLPVCHWTEINAYRIASGQFRRIIVRGRRSRRMQRPAVFHGAVEVLRRAGVRWRRPWLENKPGVDLEVETSRSSAACKGLRRNKDWNELEAAFQEHGWWNIARDSRRLGNVSSPRSGPGRIGRLPSAAGSAEY